MDIRRSWVMGSPARGPDLRIPRRTTAAHMARMRVPSLLPKESSFFWSGVSSSPAS